MTGAPCWDWWETLRWDGQIAAGGMRAGAMMNDCGLADGLGWGGDWERGVWCWDSVGRAVDVPTQRYSTYPLLSPPNPIQHQVFPTYPDHTALLHLSPLIPTQSHTTPSLSYVSRSHTHRSPHPLAPPSPNSHPQYLPYIHPTQLHSRSYPYMPTPPQRLSSVLARRTSSCALAIEYKCRTSNIHKRL